MEIKCCYGGQNIVTASTFKKVLQVYFSESRAESVDIKEDEALLLPRRPAIKEMDPENHLPGNKICNIHTYS